MMRVLVGILTALVVFHSHGWLTWPQAFNDVAPRLFK